MDPHGSAVLPFDLYGLSESLIFSGNLSQSFHVPTLNDGAKILSKKFNCLHKRHRTMPYGVAVARHRTTPHHSVNGP